MRSIHACPRRTRRTAFTLVELLVVVAILALLISLLMPTLARAKEIARKTICMTNMRSMGTGLRFYIEENDQIVAPWYVVRNQKSVNGEPDWTWHWCDFLVQYFDPSAQAVEWRSGSWYTVGRQPKSGNYHEHANLGIVYSRVMNCPSQERKNNFHYCYNRTWTANWTPGAAKPQWNSDPLPIGHFKNLAEYAQIVEPVFLWSNIYFGGSFNYIPALGAAPVHLDNQNNFTMLDGHVETWTSEQIMERTYQSLGRWDFPFVVPR